MAALVIPMYKSLVTAPHFTACTTDSEEGCEGDGTPSEAIACYDLTGGAAGRGFKL